MQLIAHSCIENNSTIKLGMVSTCGLFAKLEKIFITGEYAAQFGFMFIV
jgi:hypothetical protein